jgi:Fe-S-cluster-containing hydrogenase component 2
MACSAYHATPKYSSMNPARSRIRVVMDPFNDEFVPIRATDYAKAECDGRRTYTINGKEYSECSFCGTICPSRDLFFDPDSGLPLKCDLCEDEKEPLCVQACPQGCLTYVEVEEGAEKEMEIAKPGEIETGLQSLADKYGMQKLANAFARMVQKG